jgi:hypothetical protein
MKTGGMNPAPTMIVFAMAEAYAIKQGFVIEKEAVRVYT